MAGLVYEELGCVDYANGRKAIVSKARTKTGKDVGFCVSVKTKILDNETGEPKEVYRPAFGVVNRKEMQDIIDLMTDALSYGE